MERYVHLAENRFSKRVNITLSFALGLLFITNGVLNLSKGPDNFELIFGVVMIIAGVLYPLLMYFNFSINNTFGRWVKVTEQAVLLKNKFFRPAEAIEISKIKEIELRPYTIVFNTGRKEITFSYRAAPEASRSVKTMLIDLAESKGFPIHAG